MIIEDERDVVGLDVPYDKSAIETEGVVSRAGTSIFSSFVQGCEVEDSHIHRQLKEDLVEHLWERQGHQKEQH
jgi:hypothetical protein